MKKQLLFVALMVTVLGLGACSKKEESTTTTTTTKTETKTGDTGAANSVGVPECDAYISKFQKCISDKVPAEARDMLKSSFDQSLASWKQAASTPEGKAGLAMACKSAMDAAKQSMGSFGCEW